MFFTFFHNHFNKSRGSHNCRCRCCILPLQHLGLHTSVRGKPPLTTWNNDSPVSCVFILTAFLDFCWSDIGWKPSNQVLLRRFQSAKALPRLLRYLLPLWRGRVLRHGDDNLVNDFLLWAVYTHCYDVLPTQRCWLVESEGEVLKSSEKLFLRVTGKWLEEHPTNLLFSSSCSPACGKLFPRNCVSEFTKSNIEAIWHVKLETNFVWCTSRKNTFGDIMTATLNSPILMQVPIHIWMPEVQKFSATVKQNHLISASNSSHGFAVPDFGGHGEAELTWSLGIRRITSRNMVMFFPRITPA